MRLSRSGAGRRTSSWVMTTLFVSPGSRRVTVNPWSRASPWCEYQTESAPWSYVAATPDAAFAVLSSGRIVPRPKPAGRTRSASEDPAATRRAPEDPTRNERAPETWNPSAGRASAPGVGAGARRVGAGVRRSARKPTTNATASASCPRPRQRRVEVRVCHLGAALPTSAYVVATNRLLFPQPAIRFANQPFMARYASPFGFVQDFTWEKCRCPTR